jgi:DNA-binding Lrp family transcriptional regulator
MGIRRLDLVKPIAEMRDVGMSVRAIASATGISPTTVLKIVHALTDQDDGTIRAWMARGLDGKTRLNRLVDTTDRDARIVSAYRSDGKTMRAIAREVGCSVGTVHRVLVLAP